MILAAGEGRRMQPLTRTRAKPSLPVLGSPLVAHSARLLHAAGVREVAVNLFHQGGSVVEALEREQLDPRETDHLAQVRFRWSREESLLGTAGGIGRVRDWLAAGGTAIVANSDFLSDMDLNPLVEFHRRAGAAATLVVVEPFGPFPGELWTGPGGRVVAISTSPGVPAPGVPAETGGDTFPQGPLEFTGVQVLEPEMLARFPDRLSDSVRDVYVPALSEGRVFAWRHPGWWWEFGSLDRFLEGHLRLLAEGRCTERGTVEKRPSGVAWLAPGAELSPKASIRGAVALGAGARVAADSELEDCVISARAHVTPRCRLRRCIIGPDTVLTGGTLLEGVAAASSPCAAPSGLASSAETPGGRPAPPEGCRVEGDLWVRSIPC